MNYKVLIIDDEKNLTTVLSGILSYSQLSYTIINDPLLVTNEFLSDESIGVILCDLCMPGKNGMEILKLTKAVRPQLPVIMMTAFGAIDSAVSALKEGAFDYITKPFDAEELIRVIRKAFQFYDETHNDINLNYFDLEKKIFSKDLQSLILRSQVSDVPLHISGENGCGREFLAFLIHQKSKRFKSPFVRVNCAHFPGDLIATELFGFQKGAFTASFDSRPGKLELANGGILFLNNIEFLSPQMQELLLSVFKNNTYHQVGGAHSLSFDVRIITSSVLHLEEEVNKGNFNSELFEIFNSLSISLLPLRKMREDIPHLLSLLNEKISQKYNVSPLQFSDLALSALCNYSWPGNIVQLEKVISQLLLLHNLECVEFNHLPLEIKEYSSDFKDVVKTETQKLERSLIEKALMEKAGNITQAAHHLGLSRKGLQLKMKELGLRKEAPE